MIIRIMTKYNNSGDKDSDRNRVYLCFDNDGEMMKLIVKMMVKIKVKMRVKMRVKIKFISVLMRLVSIRGGSLNWT